MTQPGIKSRSPGPLANTLTIMPMSDNIYIPTCSFINISLWIHHVDADKTPREKATKKLHKNATSYIEQILEATPHETIAV